MNTIFHSLSEPGVLAAVEGNFAEEMACFGRSLPGAILHQDAELTWFLTGPAGPNGILLTRFVQDDQLYIDSRIEETLAQFKKHQVEEIGWRIGPTATPPDLANYLENQGFFHKATMNCMVLDVHQASFPTAMPAGLNIQEVLTVEDLQAKCEIEKIGFGASESMAQHYFQTYLNSGFGSSAGWHHYIARQDDKPVAVAAVLLHQGVAGIYGVSTLPEARQQGICTALMGHVLQEVGRLGYSIVSLSPTEMSDGIYRRLGFQDYCHLHHYRIASHKEGNEEI
ncbi:hypothetical protein KDA_32160 [Dictyobacter alpinus]|uniref:N-acetyltransferase domain-containing protein n=1 Tax=Dictyobacter alpinus TaxID=2014873 RepID=A0A402B8U6_9CHLR|nr:GNAT family N-acetyltransferase [Dictyobacter alpinus]GCE27732.1 hypothetical protein KDA_32160 [Dictyobacter alpinus]